MSQTVQRAISILEFTAVQPRSLASVAEHLSVHRSTALRLLKTLADGGLVRRLADGKYGVGYRLAGLAQLATEQFSLRAVGHPHLRTLSEATGYTVHLAALEEPGIVYVDKIEPPSALRLYSQIGRPVHLHTSGVSKAILADLPRDEALRLLAGCEFQPFTDTTITTLEQLIATFDQITDRGWATDDGEFESYVNCVAAPVRRETGAVMGAVSVTSLKAIADLAKLSEAVPDLLETTAAISKELGWG